MTAHKFSVKRSYRAGCVGLTVRLHCRDRDTAAKIEAGADITTSEARALALALTEAADSEDAKVAAKAAAEDRRKKWRDREIEAGRIIVMDAGQFMRGSR